MLEFPRPRVSALQELGARVLETYPVEGKHDDFARELLAMFHAACLHHGLDGIIEALDWNDEPTMYAKRAALSAKLGDKASYDPGGPRSAKPAQIAECLIAALGLNVIDEPDRTITLAGDVRDDMATAMRRVLDVELGIPKVRKDVIAMARAGCEERHLSAFDKLADQLDERGMKVLRQPKIPIDAVRASQLLLSDARRTVISAAANTAIDRAREILATASREAAARFEQPITLAVTPREVALRRVADPRAAKEPAGIVQGLLEALSALAAIAWKAVERPARAYAASQTFAVGDVIDHPKFGRGSVVSIDTQRMDVEFPDGKLTLVQARK